MQRIPVWSAENHCWIWEWIAVELPQGASNNAMDSEPTSGMDAPVPPTADAPALTDEQKRALADEMESLMLEVERDEANWILDDKLAYLEKHAG